MRRTIRSVAVSRLERSPFVLTPIKDTMSSRPGIITDLEMPRMGGDALIAHAKTICAEVPCFIVSGIALNSLPPGTRRWVRICE